VAADERTAVALSLSPGQAGDAPCGRELLRQIGVHHDKVALPLTMDRAYEGDETRQLARDLGYTPVVPPHPRRRKPWTYDRELYKLRNVVERLFRRLKGYRRVFTRYEKLDVMYLGMVTFALIVEALR
jgi:transposase